MLDRILAEADLREAITLLAKIAEALAAAPRDCLGTGNDPIGEGLSNQWFIRDERLADIEWLLNEVKGE